MARTKRGAASVRPPEFPPEMPTEPTESPLLADRERLAAQLWAGARFDGQRAEDVLLEYIQSRRCSFQQAELPLLQCSDSRFETDDFAGTVLEKPYLRRIAFVGCRLIGSAISDGDLEDVLFQRCQLDLARQWGTRYASVRFEHCSLREASFDGSKLAGVTFAHCDLTGADFRNASLRDADLRGSTISGIQVTSREIAGAIIDPQQALQLVELLGVVVRPLDGE